MSVRVNAYLKRKIEIIEMEASWLAKSLFAKYFKEKKLKLNKKNKNEKKGTIELELTSDLHRAELIDLLTLNIPSEPRVWLSARHIQIVITSLLVSL